MIALPWLLAVGVILDLADRVGIVTDGAIEPFFAFWGFGTVEKSRSTAPVTVKWTGSSFVFAIASGVFIPGMTWLRTTNRGRCTTIAATLLI